MRQLSWFPTYAGWITRAGLQSDMSYPAAPGTGGGYDTPALLTAGREDVCLCGRRRERLTVFNIANPYAPARVMWTSSIGAGLRAWLFRKYIYLRL